MALKRMADQEREMALIQDASRKKNYMSQQQNMYNMYLPYTQANMYAPGMQGPATAGFPPGKKKILKFLGIFPINHSIESFQNWWL